MKKFKYHQADYYSYPTKEELNEAGEAGWELICIIPEKRFFDNDLEYKITYKAIFKKEI